MKKSILVLSATLICSFAVGAQAGNFTDPNPLVHVSAPPLVTPPLNCPPLEIPHLVTPPLNQVSEDDHRRNDEYRRDEDRRRDEERRRWEIEHRDDHRDWRHEHHDGQTAQNAPNPLVSDNGHPNNNGGWNSNAGTVKVAARK